MAKSFNISMTPEDEKESAALSYADIDNDVLGAMRAPGPMYYVLMALLAGTVACGASVWLYQINEGMGVAGINHPVGWGVYIANFVFWVGIAHSGTLISAILHLIRAKWRTAVARSAEAMTVFAVMTAGLFPLFHLGRFWVVYYIFPYPSQRQLWPNFQSPLVWDVVAVTTYLIVSSIFWYVGLIPDLAVARDRWTLQHGPNHPRSRIYRWLALGWSGAGNQWRHHGRAYLFFAALATPLVISVHSVVSWDFAMGILPGWHTTIFPPYFVAGAIHSGLAMVLTLLIPLRRVLGLKRVITIDHFDSVAKTLLVTTCIVGYAYFVEPFIAWYSGDTFERQFAFWRAFEGGWMSVWFWALLLLNVIVPLAFFWRRARRSIGWLLAISILINVGMWLERYVIVTSSTSHDFLPHNWGSYCPSWVEISIMLCACGFFALWFLGFAKHVPTVSLAEMKEDLYSEREGGHAQGPDASAEQPRKPSAGGTGGVLAIFTQAGPMLDALRTIAPSACGRIETYSPFRLQEAERILGRGPGPVRYWTLTGALLGMSGGLALAIGSSMVNNLVVGGKYTPSAIVPYFIVAFEGTVLLGVVFNFVGMLVHSRLGRWRTPPSFDKRFCKDHFGLFVRCSGEEADRFRASLSPRAQEVRVVE